MIEAMACGTPVIVSNTSAMPEVAGDGALQVDPFHPDTIADALLHLEHDASFRAGLIAYGLKQATRYSWRSTAEAWVQIYREVLHSSNSN